MGNLRSRTGEADVSEFQFTASNLFVLKTLFNLEAPNLHIVNAYKKALLLFTVPHGRMTPKGLKLYSFSFRDQQVIGAVKEETDAVFDFVVSSIIKKKSQTSSLEYKFYPYFLQQGLRLNYRTMREVRQVVSIDVDNTFLENIEEWKNSRITTGIFSVNQIFSDTGYNHATVLILKKIDNRATPFEYFYFDPHGYHLPTTLDLIEEKLRLVLQTPLKRRSVSSSCPVFQSIGQGGNCTLWEHLFKICFIANPNLFDAPETVEQLLGESAEVNIMMFELFLFFMGMAAVPNYVNKLYRRRDQSNDTIDPRFYKLIETKIGIENCTAPSRKKVGACESVTHCVFFEKKCWFKEINTRLNVYSKLKQIYDEFANEHLLPLSPTFVENINSSYTPFKWELEQADTRFQPDQFWVPLPKKRVLKKRKTHNIEEGTSSEARSITPEPSSPSITLTPEAFVPVASSLSTGEDESKAAESSSVSDQLRVDYDYEDDDVILEKWEPRQAGDVYEYDDEVRIESWQPRSPSDDDEDDVTVEKWEPHNYITKVQEPLPGMARTVRLPRPMLALPLPQGSGLVMQDRVVLGKRRL